MARERTTQSSQLHAVGGHPARPAAVVDGVSPAVGGISMITSVINVDGRRLRFGVTNNVDAHGPDGPGTPPIWAINIHGYFAGGDMYNRESLQIAHHLGWRVVNPSLPGFGGSDPLEWHTVSLTTLTKQIDLICEELGIEAAVVLGHSMGGAVAVEYASSHRRATLGVIYRDGIATPAWKERRGVIPRAFNSFAPDVAPFADMAAAVVADLPDLLMGRLLTTVRSVLPDIRRNSKTIARSVPVGAMLMSIDQRHKVAALATAKMPILAEWGCFDRLTDETTAAQFAEWASTEIQWVPGGHSWMLARPSGQADILTRVVSGKAFVERVNTRWRRFHHNSAKLAAVAG